MTDEEVKADYDAAKDSYDVPEKRRVPQLTFSDKAAAEKAYAELSKAKDFDAAAAKLGFPADDIKLGFLTRAEMIDPKIADAAFKLKLNELSSPVEGQFSVVLLRVTEIEGGKKRTFEEAKGEIKERIAGERVGEQVQTMQEKVEAARAKGTPLKEIAAEVKLPFQEVAAIDRTGKTADGKAVIAHADGAKIAEAIFGATEGVETEVLELSDGGFAWIDLLGVTPERQRPFEEVADQGARRPRRRRAGQGDGEPGGQAGRAPQGRGGDGRGGQVARRQGRTNVADQARRQPATARADGGRAAGGLQAAQGRRRLGADRRRQVARDLPRGRHRRRPGSHARAGRSAEGRRGQAAPGRCPGPVRRGACTKRYGISINEKELLQALGVQPEQPGLEGGN